MPKICLITSEESFLTNYGAALQGYALYKILCENGYEVKILRYKGGMRKISKSKFFVIYNTLRKYSFHEIFLKVLFRISKIRYKTCIEKQITLFKNFQIEYMNFYDGERIDWIDLENNWPLADIYICGSDQIWNPNFKDGYNDLGYFLYNTPNNAKRIAYAPSFGVKDIPDTAISNLKQLLDRFNSISVREKTGKEIIKKYTDIDAKVVLDPTLLLDKEEWKKIECKPTDLPDKYILCYRFGNSLEVNENIKKIQSILQIPIITLPLSGISYYNKDEIKYFEAGPEEFIGLIENATLVCTDSFHATVFSIIMETPFISFNRMEGMNSRIHDLLQSLDLNNNLYNEKSIVNIDQIFNTDFTKAKNKLQSLRKESVKWLESALGRHENENN